ncbi:MAG: DUF362 domain-containing protein [Chloroflexi bacterium]|nr:DUF362 domain-containing protein [Chloroflexota bacterium]
MAMAAAAAKAGLGALSGCMPVATLADVGPQSQPVADDELTSQTSADHELPAEALADSGLTPKAYVPNVAMMPTYTPTPTSTPVPPPTGPRVVHVHGSTSTFWSGQTDFWNYVRQDTVNTMADRGLMALTGTASVANAWRALLPNYRAGQGIAIKVNFNNSTSCSDSDGQIDGLIQPVNALVRGMKQMGVAETDIWVYDASRRLPARFVGGCLYSGVQFIDPACNLNGGYASWASTDPHAFVTYHHPTNPSMPRTRISDVLIDATYLINMPIMKPHRIARVTLTFKNHFGNISEPWELHPYIGMSSPTYRSDYSPLVDIYRNAHVGAKTILVVGDALLAAKDFDAAPAASWATFGNKPPQSLFFATDPVAADCVMADHLRAELGSSDEGIPSAAYDYLRLAAAAGLGEYEQGDPWHAGYSHIDYLKIEV